MATNQPSATAADPQAPRLQFDLDTGNFLRDLIRASADTSGEEQAMSSADSSIIIHLTHTLQTAWFDALAPYHPTAVGVHARIGRRPAGESATNRNKNIAGLHATLQLMKAFYPERMFVIQKLWSMLGLDADDESEDPTSPVGIGNMAGKAAVRARSRDGMNLLGDEGRAYNEQPYGDYTGYQPVNSTYELVDPSRWQPATHPHRRRVGGGPGDNGVWVIQRFATPQLALVKPQSYQDPRALRIAPPDHIDHIDPASYKREVNTILEASAALTDEQKAMAEFFDNTFLGIGQSTQNAAVAHDLDLDGWVQLLFTTSVAQFDGLIACWHYKREYDAVRPLSAVRHVYGNQKVTAWGGPGKGTVDNMPADEWSSYLPTAGHPEYPSATATLGAAQAQAARRFLGDDVLDWTYPCSAGSTLTEPGITPAKDIELRFPTWTDFEMDCATSRVWGGVHFRTTVERTREWGAQFGDLAYEFVQRHLNGDVKD
jgi:vanadium-dependent haloperoxidase-like protein/uncharacterized protein DUF6851